jgi:hypothetical protein
MSVSPRDQHGRSELNRELNRGPKEGAELERPAPKV